MKNPNAPVEIARMQDQGAMKYSNDGFLVALCARSGMVDFFASPMEIPTLQHICRMSVRRCLADKSTADVILPQRLIRFLDYTGFFAV